MPLEKDRKSATQTVILCSAHVKVMSQLKDGDKEVWNPSLHTLPPLSLLLTLNLQKKNDQGQDSKAGED